MKHRRTTKRRSRFTRARREAMDLVKFIDAHGGKLAPFRAYRVAPPSTSPSPPPPNVP
jgi:hypothetical protein